MVEDYKIHPMEPYIKVPLVFVNKINYFCNPKIINGPESAQITELQRVKKLFASNSPHGVNDNKVVLKSWNEIWNKVDA